MAADVISLVEDDLVNKLKAAVAGTKLRVQDLPGDWDDDMLRRLLTLAPCVLVAFTGGSASNPGAQEAAIAGQWAVYAVTSHPSGEGARRRGNAQALGAYELLSRLIVPTLHGHKVAGVGSLSLARIENLFTGMVEKQGLAVYAAAFNLPMSFALDQTVGLDDFATFVAQFDVPPHAPGAEHRKWPAGDYSNSRPDSTDTVLLPTQP